MFPKSLINSIELQAFTKSFRNSDHLVQFDSASESDGLTRRYSPRDDDREIESKLQRKSRGLFEGWKFTIFLAFGASVVVLLFNISFLIFTGTRSLQGKDAALSRGDCEMVHRLSTGYHWIINVLSTILLAASNFGMVLKRSRGNFQYISLR